MTAAEILLAAHFDGSFSINLIWITASVLILLPFLLGACASYLSSQNHWKTFKLWFFAILGIYAGLMLLFLIFVLPKL